MADDAPRRRRLSAIFMVDVVGFSRMMGRDEEGTTARILEFHERVRRGIEQRGGRVVSTAGDSVFGDFESIVEAFELAVEIQEALDERNHSVGDDERFQARIGLHLGDVIEEGGDLYGDGINVAARLEQIADPGGIMLSEAAYQLVRGRVDVPIEDLGLRALKNIAEPVRVYRISPEAMGGSPVDGAGPTPADAAGRTIRDAVVSAVDRIADQVETSVEEAAGDEDGAVAEPGRVVTIFRAGNLVMVTLGVLGILASTSGWSDNGLYPFLGSWLLANGVGGAIERAWGQAGVGRLLGAIGLAAGAFFLGRIAVRAVIWVLAAANVGQAIQRMSSPGRKSRPTPRTP